MTALDLKPFVPPAGLSDSTEETQGGPGGNGSHVSSTSAAQIDETADESGGFSGVHDVVKSVDYWFEREMHQLETEVDTFAVQWANENLPSITERRDQPLEPEQVIIRRCGELWQRWPERIQVKMQDAIDSAATELSARVGNVRGALTEMKVASEELRDAESRIEAIRREDNLTRGPVGYARYFSQWVTWGLAILLVCVEFVANQPVFRIIWPMPSGVAAAMADRVEAVDPRGAFSGVELMFMETSSYVEASLVAASVVILLFVLAKTVGTAVRPMVSLRPSDYSWASRSIQSLHRQKRVVFGTALLGSLLILAFLFQSRAGASQVASERADAATVNVTRLQARSDSLNANGFDPSSAQTTELEFARAELGRLQADFAFARTIERNNGSILVLNISLVCFAFVVGFMSDARTLPETLGEHPDLRPLREKCVRLRQTIVRYADQAREEARLADHAMSRVNSLLRSRPLGTIHAKRERLDSLVPRWRGQNARLRGIDPALIASFKVPLTLDLPEIAGDVPLVKPDTFDRAVEELRSMRNDLFRVESVANGPVSQTA